MNEREALEILHRVSKYLENSSNEQLHCALELDEVKEWLRTRIEIKELCDDPNNLSASDAPYFKKVANLYAQDAHFGLEVFMRHKTELCILHHAIIDARKAKMYFEMPEVKHD